MKKEFNKWFNDYFQNMQGEDSPYTYEDIEKAFKMGYKKGKQHISERKWNIK